MAEIRCNVITDSDCDFTPEKVSATHITYTSFTYAETNKPDGGFHGVDDLFQSITPTDFYQAMRDGAAPFTSQPSQADFEKVFQAAIDTGLPSVYLSMSSGISGAWNGACTALERMEEEAGKSLPITIVDTGVASTALYLLVSEAIRRRDSGCTAQEIAKWAESAKYRIRTCFMVDNLDTLHHGGRIPKTVAVIAGGLDVKPLLGWNLDGTLKIMGVTRGRKKGIKKMLEYYETHRDRAVYSQTLDDADKVAGMRPLLAGNLPKPLVALGNADCKGDTQHLAHKVHALDPEARVDQPNIGPVICCHVGPGMMSCCFWGKDRRDDPEKLKGKISGIRGV